MTYSLQDRLTLFPDTTTLAPAPPGLGLSIAGCSLESLAKSFGTPLYLYDRATLDHSLVEYSQALEAHYPGKTGVTYAGKAFLCLAMAQWVQAAGLTLDCTGAGELHLAASAGLPPAQVLVHGVNKSAADLEAAFSQAGTLVADSLPELERIAGLAARLGRCPDLWLRLRPGLAVETHRYTQTGQETSKFGLSPNEFLEGVRFCRARGLPLTGLHFHQGSHFHDPAPLGPAIAAALELGTAARRADGWTPQVFCPGGGWGVAYHEQDLPHPPAQDYIAFVAGRLAEGCRRLDLPLPRLQLEPGRRLVARAGVAVYQVGAVKHSGGRRWLLLDGGLADNPRPALYGARYSALPVMDPDRPDAGPAWLAGPFCESGDILIQDLPLPDILPGEYLAVPVSGAYQLSMGSNYNGARRPAVLWLADGSAQLIQRRETLADLVRRDLPLPA